MPRPRTRRSPWAAVPLGLALIATLGLTACGTSAGDTGSSSDPGQLAVLASFYPLQYVADAVGGDAVTVTNLTKTGAEPHDLELTPQDVATLSDADLAVYLSDFQPAVDDAIASSDATSLDIS